jgi:membrane dipeptidase
VGEGALRRALRFVEAAWTMARRHEDEVALVTTASELRATLAGGRIALVLAFEGMEPVGHDLALIDVFWRLGVRLASLTWNRRTMFADGLGESATAAGLSSLGLAAVERMEDLGMILDVSHLSDAGFSHVAEVARRPFVASHSSCRSVYPHPRNLTDEMLRAIADADGFACMNAVGAFCADRATVDDYVAHVAHAVEVVGAARVGLGLDFISDLLDTADPVLGGALVEKQDLGLIEALQRPADLAALGPRLVARLGQADAAMVASGTLSEGLARLLPA